MIINRLKLENIRSYENQEIHFPAGTILLSGNIGSGKSSALLAIEFALFGLRRDSGLLRNGSSKGSVELNFSIDNRDVTIKRVLKRSKNSVAQDTGYIIIDNEKRELTSTELKQLILDMFKYPVELLSKSKDLIYRYTVFTPQEEMKHILLTDSESRLDILRRVFGIDRYKRIIENAGIYLSYLKERKNNGAILIKDLDERIDKRKEMENDIRSLDEKIRKSMPVLNESRAKIDKLKENLKEQEKNILMLNGLKKDIDINNIELRNKSNQKKRNEEELNEIERHIKGLKEEIKELRDINIGESIEIKNNEIRFMETTYREIISKIKEFETKKNVSEDIKKKINSLDICPLCKQNVSKEYKHNIIENEERSQKDFLDSIKNFREREKEADEKLKTLRLELDKLKKEESNIEISKLRILTLKEKQERLDKLKALNEELKGDIGKINREKEKIEREIELLKNSEKENFRVKDEFENEKKKEREVELKIYGYEKEMEGFKKNYDILLKEIDDKLKIREQTTKIAKMQEFIEERFVELISTMEKQIMSKVHNDFSLFFEKWFSVLVDDETINIGLDRDFTPVINHNGHEMDYIYLSGGEKTAAALAYRLALNQVINTISHIKTKDIIILDEPTDGFSSDQLDRMRIILEELKMKQIIIVSHDPKIEGFVDSIIRLDKKDNTTRLL